MMRSRMELPIPIERPACTTCGGSGKVLAASCPDCRSDDFTMEPYDYGASTETGYRDCGVRAKCRPCGFDGDLQGDFERLVRCDDCDGTGNRRAPEGEDDE